MTAQATAGPAIRVRGLEKSYGKLEALGGVDFEVARGSILALLGPNGAGKTTVIKILSTLLKADGGAARVNGFDVATQPADVRASISLTGQFAAVDEVLSGRENLVLVARLRRRKDPGRIADDLLERFSLTDAATRKVATYSGGMRRRLDIAMSLIGNPPVIFLDEPTAGLDPEGRIEVWQTVKELAGQGTTVLLTTQYLEEAEQPGVRGAAGRPSQGADPCRRPALPPREGPRRQGLRSSPLPQLPHPAGDEGPHRPPWDRVVAAAWPPSVEGRTLDRLAGRVPAAAHPLRPGL
jgi:ABC-2 type transport system ATP-binding protein